MSRDIAHAFWGGISRKPLEIETWVQRSRHVTLKGQGHDPNMFDAHYLENGWR